MWLLYIPPNGNRSVKIGKDMDKSKVPRFLANPCTNHKCNKRFFFTFLFIFNVFKNIFNVFISKKPLLKISQRTSKTLLKPQKLINTL